MLWRRKQRDRIDADIDAEFRFHLEQRAADLERTGLSPEAAQRQAKLEFGSVNQHKEAARGVWFSRALSDFVADTRFAFRLLLKSPAFTITAVLTLALGIGATTAIFSLVYGVLYRPLPFPDADRIAMIYLHFSPQNNPRGGLSLADFVDVRNQTHSFEKVAAFTRLELNLGGGGYTEPVGGAAVTADFFSVLGTPTVLGRTFRAGEDSGSSPRLIVISEALWRRRFQSDPSVIGRVVELNAESATIVGVVRAPAGIPAGNVEIWQNQRLDPKRRGPFFYRAIGVLRPGVSFSAAQAELNALGSRIEHANPTGYSGLTIPIEPLRDALTYRVRAALLVIFGSVIAVLLIAAVNIANLLLARASARHHEMAVRASLGATRERLLRQMLTESVLLSLVGATAGTLLAYWAIQTFKAANVAGIPLTDQVTLNAPVLAFTLVVSLLTGVLFGLVPAFQSARPDATDPLRLGTRGSGATRATQLRRSALVVSEVALSFILLVAAGLLFRSLLRLQHVDAGFSTPSENVLTMQISPKPQRPGDPNADQRRFSQFY